jgi:vancomycin permeability regulator SanA
MIDDKTLEHNKKALEYYYKYRQQILEKARKAYHIKKVNLKLTSHTALRTYNIKSNLDELLIKKELFKQKLLAEATNK